MLELNGVDAGYGGLQVLFGLDLDVRAGERLALLGTNGAGKSTALRVAAGLLAPSAGRVLLDGEDITAVPAERRAALGLSLVVGGRSSCPGLTVSENLRLGAWSVLGSRGVVDARLDAVLALFPALRPRLSTAAGALSGGEQQMMAVGRALMGAPRILLVDELSLGLAPIVVGHVLDAVTAVAETGVTVVLVEQSLNVAAAVCERCVFMEKGEVRFTGPTDELAARGDLARSVFLGTR